MLESVGKDSVVPGLLASTFAGSADEDIAAAVTSVIADGTPVVGVNSGYERVDDLMGFVGQHDFQAGQGTHTT